MPIKGLTDRGMSFPEIGVIRKGKKETRTKGNKKYEVPVDLNYFRIDLDEKEVEATVRFKGKYGEEPDEIDILLPFDEIDRCWDAWMEAYTAGRMVARSDGEFFTYLVDIQTGDILVKEGKDVKTGLPVPHREVIGKTGKSVIKCKPSGRLKVIIPVLQRLAYVTLKTTSYWDVVNISEQLKALKNISGGFLKGIPLVLRRRPKMISTPGTDGKRVRREKWLVSIEADPSWVQPKFDEAMRLAMPSGDAVMELPETVDAEMETDEFEIIEEGEFTDAPEDDGGPLWDQDFANADENERIYYAVTGSKGLYKDQDVEALRWSHQGLLKMVQDFGEVTEDNAEKYDKIKLKLEAVEYFIKKKTEEQV